MFQDPCQEKLARTPPEDNVLVVRIPSDVEQVSLPGTSETKTGRHQCEECDAVFCSSSSLCRHRRLHRRHYRKHCPNCQKGFMDVSGLRKHLVNCEIRRTQPSFIRQKRQKPVQCKECNDFFSSSSSLFKHRVQHHRQYKKHCPKCQKGFMDASGLRKHLVDCEKRSQPSIKRKKRSNPAWCEECDVWLCSSSSLCRHKRLHRRQYRINCPRCNKGFMDSTGLRRHLVNCGLRAK